MSVGWTVRTGAASSSAEGDDGYEGRKGRERERESSRGGAGLWVQDEVRIISFRRGVDRLVLILDVSISPPLLYSPSSE